MKQIRWWMPGAVVALALLLGPAVRGQYEPPQIKPPAPVSPSLPIQLPVVPGPLTPVTAPPAPAAPAPPPRQELLLEEIRDLLAKRGP